MGSISGDSVDWSVQDYNAQEEKIFVAVRLRPLNERELEKNDVSDWDCINNTTIIFKNTFQERSMFPTALAFDRVFGSDSPTSQVYEEAAKKIALSVLSGINSTIFAYGQTSSGKTYTMSGVTECAVEDIYDYIDKHSEREFVLKFSALEIYNELVKDLLSTEGTPLRLLDDPERGTVVDKLTEVTLRDSSHLKELLTTCESQRQIGETSLNEMSSRSHQILRLTVESEAREYLGALNSSTLTASVNFVDLAGSERASQALSAGTRLKEGCHINRSLLTLGTVIRKLSKGRNGHIPYRDSKLTRILQNSLGGNAKTAIICTMSPAHTHLEQSRNTLLFANCAKQVSTSAQVNVVMSEKALVKQLQKELARLENELRHLSSLASSTDSMSALKEKELLIEKMDKEIRELTNQRDLAQSRVENMLRSGSESQASRSWVDMNGNEKGSLTDEYSASEASEIIDPLRYDAVSSISHFTEKYEGFNSGRIEFLENSEEHFLSDDTSPSSYIDKYFGPDPCKGWEKIGQENNQNYEDNCKEVQCIEIDFSKNNMVRGAGSPKNRNQASGQYSSSSDEDVSDSSVSVLRNRNSGAILITMTESPKSKVMKENKYTSQDKADNQRKEFGLEPAEISENLYTKEFNSSIRSEFRNEKEQNIKTTKKEYTTEKPEGDVKELDEVIKSTRQTEDDLLHEYMNHLEPAAENESLRAKDSQRSASVRKEAILENEQNVKTLNEDSRRELNEVIERKSVGQFEDDLVHKHINRLESSADTKDSQNSVRSRLMNEKEQKFRTSNEDLMAMHEARVREYNEVIKLESMDHMEDDMDTEEDAKTSNDQEKAANDVLNKAQDIKQSASDWDTEFEKQKREIIELWDACNIPLVHRSYFFLLFQGDPSDAVYMEVELRRLSYLKNALHGVRVIKDDEFFAQATSKKALSREREMLSRRMLKRFSGKDREALYQKWGIDLKTKKRRLQLCRKLWTDATNMEHVKESAAIVAKLVGFKEPGQAPKEMVGLNLAPKPENLRTFSWRR